MRGKDELLHVDQTMGRRTAVQGLTDWSAQHLQVEEAAGFATPADCSRPMSSYHQAMGASGRKRDEIQTLPGLASNMSLDQSAADASDRSGRPKPTITVMKSAKVKLWGMFRLRPKAMKILLCTQTRRGQLSGGKEDEAGRALYLHIDDERPESTAAAPGRQTRRP